MPHQPADEITIADLYPELSPDEREEAAYNLRRYLDLVRRIYERRRKLTDPKAKPTLKEE